MVSTRIQLIRNAEIRAAVMALSDAGLPITPLNVFRHMTNLEPDDRRKTSGLSKCLRMLAAAGVLSRVRDDVYEVLDPVQLATPTRNKRIPKRAELPAAPVIVRQRVATVAPAEFQPSSIRQLTPQELRQGRAKPARRMADVR